MTVGVWVDGFADGCGWEGLKYGMCFVYRIGWASQPSHAWRGWHDGGGLLVECAGEHLTCAMCAMVCGSFRVSLSISLALCLYGRTAAGWWNINMRSLWCLCLCVWRVWNAVLLLCYMLYFHYCTHLQFNDIYTIYIPNYSYETNRHAHTTNLFILNYKSICTESVNKSKLQ